MLRGRVRYRRATINDVETLVGYRIRFLKELGAQKGRIPQEPVTEILKRNLRGYSAKLFPPRISLPYWLRTTVGSSVQAH